MKNIHLCLKTISTYLLTIGLSAQTASDTIFLLKDSNYKIYIEPNKNDVKYRSFVKESKDNKILDLPAKWVPLYVHKDNYYVYEPCDLGTNMSIYLSKKQIYFYGFEINNHKLNSKLKKVEDSHYGLSYIDLDKKIVSVDIYIIDKLKMVSIFKYKTQEKKISYQLMIDQNKINEFQMIVNECTDNKVQEFTFETVDYQKLIKEAK